MDDVEAGPSERSSGRPGAPADPYRLQRALWDGRWILIIASVLGVALGVFVAKVLMGNAYKTTALLQYEGDVEVAGIEGSSIYSLGPAASALKRPAFLKRLAEEVGFKGSLKALGRHIEYEVDYLPRTLHLSVYGDTAEESADRTHLVTELFLDHHRERQAKRVEQEIAQIDERIKSAQAEAEDARRRYNDFRKMHGIANLSTEQQSLVKSAVDLRSNSDLAASEIRALEGRVKSLQAQLSSIPKTTVVSSGDSPERAAYNRLRQELASARASLSDDHPRVQALQQQVNQLQAQLRNGPTGSGLVSGNSTYTAVSNELRSAEAQLTLMRERQKGLTAMAEKAQSRVESLSGIEGEASALLADVQVNEALISRLQANRVALEDVLEHPPSGFTVLEPGSPPEYPERNKQKPIVFVVIAGLFVALALFYVLWREFRGLRAATPAEIAFWGNGPVVGTSSWPADEQGLDELVAGLDDFAPNAQGTLLIVGGLPNDSVFAYELARRMNDDWHLDPSPSQPSGAHRPRPSGPPPIQTPPPSGPYPIGGAPQRSTARAPSTALALRPVQLVRREERLQLDAWEGPYEGQALRRAARLADRVLVLVRSGTMDPKALNAIPRRLGRHHGVGYIVLSLPDDLRTLPDRVGPVNEFWQGVSV